MALIGYTCSYIPVELLSATGHKPYRLLHGNADLIAEGERWLRVDACPLVKSNLGYLMRNKEEFVAVVGSTGCDMARRMLDVVDEIIDLPVFILNNPRTDNQQIYYEEIEWLKKELEYFSNRKFSYDQLISKIARWENIREQYRIYDKKRASNPSVVSTVNFHKLCMNYHQGNIESKIVVTEASSDKPRVYLLGSPISYESNEILSLLEENFRIVGDFNCGISRFLNIKVGDKNLNAIKDTYYSQPPCIYKRPNKGFYDFIDNKIKQLNCSGIIAWTLDYCDSYEFELRRMERRFGLPMLRLQSDFSFQNLNQLKTRIEAFQEMINV